MAAGHNVLAGRNIYTTSHTEIPEDKTLTWDIPEYLYPPLLALCFIPFTVIKFSLFRHLWTGLSIFCVFHALYMFHAPLWAYALMLVGAPFWWLIATGQVDGLILWLLAVSYGCYQTGHIGASATLMAFACWFKLTPALAAIYLLSFGSKVFIATFGVAVVCLGLIQYAVFGRLLIQYFTEILPRISTRREAPPYAQSLAAMMPNLYLRNTARVLVVAAYVISLLRHTGVEASLCAMVLLPNLGWTMQFINVVVAMPVCWPCSFLYLLPARQCGAGLAAFVFLLLGLYRGIHGCW